MTRLNCSVVTAATAGIQNILAPFSYRGRKWGHMFCQSGNEVLHESFSMLSVDESRSFHDSFMSSGSTGDPQWLSRPAQPPRPVAELEPPDVPLWRLLLSLSGSDWALPGQQHHRHSEQPHLLWTQQTGGQSVSKQATNLENVVKPRQSSVSKQMKEAGMETGWIEW